MQNMKNLQNGENNNVKSKVEVDPGWANPFPKQPVASKESLHVKATMSMRYQRVDSSDQHSLKPNSSLKKIDKFRSTNEFIKKN